MRCIRLPAVTCRAGTWLLPICRCGRLGCFPDSRVDGTFHVVQAFLSGLSKSIDDALVTSDKRRDRYAFGGAERCIPRRAMGYGFVGGEPVADELFAGGRVLPFGESRKLFRGDGASQAHFFRKFAAPLAFGSATAPTASKSGNRKRITARDHPKSCRNDDPR